MTFLIYRRKNNLDNFSWKFWSKGYSQKSYWKCEFSDMFSIILFLQFFSIKRLTNSMTKLWSCMLRILILQYVPVYLKAEKVALTSQDKVISWLSTSLQEICQRCPNQWVNFSIMHLLKIITYQNVWKQKDIDSSYEVTYAL